MYSIRRRLLIALAAGITLLIAGAGLYAQDLLARRAAEQFDETLLGKARALFALTEQEDGKIELDYKPGFLPGFERAERPDHFQYWLDDGRPLVRSQRLAKTEDLPRRAAFSLVPHFDEVVLASGATYRTAQISFVPRSVAPGSGTPLLPDPAKGVRGVVLVVGSDRAPLDTLVAQMRFTILAPAAAAILLAALLVWRLLAVGLRPIDQVSRQVERLDAESLGTRIALPRTPREIAPIVQQLNALLERLEEAFHRERRFTGNVAHELRTPIAELRTLAEVAARWPEEGGRFFEDVQEIAGQMERIVADLLLLARCQAGVERVDPRPADLRRIVEAGCSRLRERARKKGSQLRVEVGDDLAAASDPDKLAIIVGNLLENAVSHSPSQSEIRCTARREGGVVRLEISNPAVALAPGDLARLGEPFWRKDEARTPLGHCGLGLAIVTALAKLLRHDLDFALDPDGVFHARLSLLSSA